MAQISVDETDRRILDALQSEGRAGYAELARKVCFVLKVVAGSMRHLEQVTGRIGGLGSVTTSIVYSSPLPARAVTAP